MSDLIKRLDALEPDGGRGSSVWTREDFDAIMRARDRGVTWRAIGLQLWPNTKSEAAAESNAQSLSKKLAKKFSQNGHALWAHNPECDEWKARALNAIAYLEKLPPILERIKAMRLPEQPPDRDHDDEWHAYVHANAVNHTIDAVLALFDVSRQEPVGSFSDLPAANLAGPEGDARPACEHGYHAPHRYSRTFDGMIERVWCHGPQS